MMLLSSSAARTAQAPAATSWLPVHAHYHFPQPAAFAMRLFEQKIGFIIVSDASPHTVIPLDSKTLKRDRVAVRPLGTGKKNAIQIITNGQ